MLTYFIRLTPQCVGSEASEWRWSVGGAERKSAVPPDRGVGDAVNVPVGVCPNEPVLKLDSTVTGGGIGVKVILAPVFESGKTPLEAHLYRVDRTRTVLGHDKLGESAYVVPLGVDVAFV